MLQGGLQLKKYELNVDLMFLFILDGSYKYVATIIVVSKTSSKFLF
jgi:hypothetical protein